MKVILLFTILVNILYSSWTFTKDDLDNMNDYQRDVYYMAKTIGESNGLGDALVKISAVETRLGLLRANNGKYCGPMQIAVRYHGVSCDAVRTNTYLSMKIAVDELKYWLRVHNGDMDKAYVSYNGGHSENPHGKEYLRRINLVGKVLNDYGFGFCY